MGLVSGFGSGSDLFANEGEGDVFGSLDGDTDDAEPTIDVARLREVASNEASSVALPPVNSTRVRSPWPQDPPTQPAQRPVDASASPSAPSAAANPVEGREVVLALAQVLCDPKDNVSRGGRAWLPTDKEVRETAYTIEHEGLIHPCEVRRLSEPLPRDTSLLILGRSVTHYTHRLSSGFKRFAALQLLDKLGCASSRFSEVSEVDVNDDRAMLRNQIENIVRSDPSDYNLALLFAQSAKKNGWTPTQVAREVGAQTFRVEQLILIATRLPPELLDVFRLNPSPENRRVLSRIAAMPDAGGPDSKALTHQMMIDEYARIQAGDLNEAELRKQAAAGRGAGNGFGGGSAAAGWYQRRLGTAREMNRQASGWVDSTGQTREVTSEQREYGERLLAWLQSPKTTRNPLR